MDKSYCLENWRIDPFAITDFNRNQSELELMLIFCYSVAGKKATMIAGMVEDFLVGSGYAGSPFERIRAMIKDEVLEDNLRRARLGKYGLLTRGLKKLVEWPDLDLRCCTPDMLEKIPGIGMKTSRFFILHTRKNAQVAVIDTHMLKYLRSIGVERVPDSVPTGKNYLRLENIILTHAKTLGLSQSDFDLKVWSWYSAGQRDAGKLKNLLESDLAGQ